MCNIIKAWWIRRWYFLYISAFTILHRVTLSRSCQTKYKTYFWLTFNTCCYYYIVPIIYDFYKESFYDSWLLYTIQNSPFQQSKPWIFENKTYVLAGISCWLYFHVCFRSKRLRLIMQQLGRTFGLSDLKSAR